MATTARKAGPTSPPKPARFGGGKRKNPTVPRNTLQTGRSALSGTTTESGRS